MVDFGNGRSNRDDRGSERRPALALADDVLDDLPVSVHVVAARPTMQLGSSVHRAQRVGVEHGQGIVEGDVVCGMGLRKAR